MKHDMLVKVLSACGVV